ncbi:S8 family serine peptidase [Paenibacillus glycanilyticus]|uniref:S8 family serine peptidase n=1 Tax=Paenibacillus glycanilyticus TaxID=126569 RepID=UPI00203DFF0F|nr:S8 family serine peptidase [Paenibacillus glycanilyticus]MCM3629077.1 S8 family serine peptidase [Paenibacillus glycanilyticus]
MKRHRSKQVLAAALSLATAFGLTVTSFAAGAGAAVDQEPVKQTTLNQMRKSQWPPTASIPVITDSLSSDDGIVPQTVFSIPVTEQDKFLTSLRKQREATATEERSRIIVKFKQGAADATYRSEFAATSEARMLPGTDLMVLETMPANATTILAELKDDPNVEFAELDVKVRMASVPNDPLFPNQWGLHNVGQIIDGPIKGLPGFDINVMKAWEMGHDGNDVVVAVLDTGIDISHPDLKANIWRNAGEIPNNGMDDDGDGYADDVNGWDFYNDDRTVFDASQGDFHGTAVAGVIAASANNGVGISGVAPNVQVLPLKVLGPDGTGYASDVIRAIHYADRAGARIANMSWTTDTYSRALEDAIKASSMLFTVSAGNEVKEDNTLKAPKNLDEYPVYPASYDSPNLVSVASVGADGSFAYFSNYGQKTVDLAAPGFAVLSTVPSRNIGLGAQIDNGTFKAVYNVIGFEAMQIVEQRREAFNNAMQFLSNTDGEKPSVLLVQDDMHDIGNPDTLPVYANLLEDAGYEYDVETVPMGANGPALDKLTDYEAVIWFTGFGNSSLEEADVENMTAYLNGGGHLLLTGPGSLFRLADSPFVRDTLHLDFVRFEDSENESWGFASGVAGTIYDGANYSLKDQGIFSDVETNDAAVARINLEIPVEDYGKSTGTSISAPYAAGVAALLLGQDPAQDAATVRTRLLLSGKPLDSLKGKTSNGKMLDAFGALSDDELPGRSLEGGSLSGKLDLTENWDDVYFVHLLQGDTLSLTLTGSAESDFDLYLYDNSAKTIQSSVGMVAHSETEGSSGESIVYRALETGYYFVNVHAFEGAGTYKLNATLDRTSTHGEGVYENNDPALEYVGKWSTVSDAGYSNGTLKRLDAAGSVSFAFYGGEVAWLGMKGPDQGIADVFIDGVKVASPSLFNKWKQLNQVIWKQSVPKGPHTLTIKWTGMKDSLSTGTSINVDAIQVAVPSEAYTVRLEENDLDFEFKGSWKKRSDAEFSNGHAMESNTVGDEAVLSFTGTRAVLLSKQIASENPMIAVTVDDRPESEVIINLNAVKDAYQAAVFDTGKLPNGKHSIRIINVTEVVSIGKKPVIVDTLIVTKATKEEAVNTSTTSIEDTNASVKFEGLWQTNLSPRNSGNSARYSNQTNSSVEVKLRGTKIIIIGTKGPDRGKADIYVDGELVTPSHIDLYSPSYEFQSRLFELPDLGSKQHTIKIVNVGDKNPKSSGYYISFDAIKVIGDQFDLD